MYMYVLNHSGSALCSPNCRSSKLKEQGRKMERPARPLLGKSVRSRVYSTVCLNVLVWGPGLNYFVSYEYSVYDT